MCLINFFLLQDLEKSEILFYKNEQSLGVAFSDLRWSPEDIIFPHVCTKNCKIEVNFGVAKSESWLNLERIVVDFEERKVKFVDFLDRQFLVRGLLPPSSKNECTASYTVDFFLKKNILECFFFFFFEIRFLDSEFFF